MPRPLSDGEAQIIVAHDVTQSAGDCGQLIPMTGNYALDAAVQLVLLGVRCLGRAEPRLWLVATFYAYPQLIHTTVGEAPSPDPPLEQIPHPYPRKLYFLAGRTRSEGDNRSAGT
jgi:hypothetical protein